MLVHSQIMYASGFFFLYHTNECAGIHGIYKSVTKRHFTTDRPHTHTHQTTVYSSPSHLELAIDIKHWAAAEPAQSWPPCLRILHETNKSMQITSCILGERNHGHSAEVTLPCVFVFLMDYLSSLILELHHKRHITHDGLHDGKMEHMFPVTWWLRGSRAMHNK